MVVLAVIVAAVSALVFVYFESQGHKPAPTSSPQPATQKKAPAPPKNSDRMLAPTTVHYYQFHVALDGTLQTNKDKFHLYAADIPGREYTCRYRNGQRWACGLRSYVALVNLIGSALIECRAKDALKPDVVICHHNIIDLSEWMLRKGWARLENGVTEKRYVEAAKTASAAKIGMWAEEPQPQKNAAPH